MREPVTTMSSTSVASSCWGCPCGGVLWAWAAEASASDAAATVRPAIMVDPSRPLRKVCTFKVFPPKGPPGKGAGQPHCGNELAESFWYLLQSVNIGVTIRLDSSWAVLARTRSTHARD